MVDKLVDIRPRKKSKNEQEFVWSKPNVKHKLDQAMPVLVVGLIIILLTTFTVLVQRGKSIAKEIIALTESGYSSLELAKENVKSAEWDQAITSFKESQQVFNELKTKSVFFEGSVASPKYLAEAGDSLAKAGELMSGVVIKISDLPEKILENNLTGAIRPATSITDEIESVLPQVAETADHLENAIENLNKINQSLIPADFKPKFQSALTDLESIGNKFIELESDLPSILSLLGNERSHRYLILVQNNYELRPTGGFIGNLLFAEVREGYLTEFEKHDVYDYDGQLGEPEVIPPEYVGFVDDLGIRDANYNPNFADSARLVDKLMQRAKAPSADTIIAVDHKVLSDLLKLTGGIRLQDYPRGIITAENFPIVLTYLIESQKDVNEADKGILKGFVEELKSRLLTTDDITGLLRILSINAQTKHIQIYSKDQNLQEIYERFGLAGKVTETADDEDYILVTNSSIGGNKTDPYIKERIIHNTLVDKKGRISNEVTIRKFHSFKDTEEYYWQNILRPFGVTKLHDPTRYVLGRGDNVSQMKVYVPFGSELTSAEGIDLETIQTFNDADTLKTYFLFPMSVTPKETAEIKITYLTPIKLDISPAGAYKLNIQKQAGTDDVIFEKHYTLGDKVKAHTYYPTDYEISKEGEYSHEMVLDSDKKMATVLSR